MLGKVLCLALLALAVAVPVDPKPSKITEDLKNVLKTSTHSDIMIRMAARADPLELVSTVSLTTKAEKGAFVRNSLLRVAAESQAELKAVLGQRNAVFKSFWITNTIFVKEADAKLIAEIAERLDIESIDIVQTVHIFEPLDVQVNVSKSNGNEWGVEKIGAPKVWAAGNKGKGVVVATIDTGARFTHEALVGSYRGNNNGVFEHNYNWFQPTGKSPKPVDNNGHGSHVVGTIAGTNGIGVAPEAKWIACQGCASFGCSQYDLTTCGEWIACPTDVNGENEDCSAAPDVVNNSWGGGQANPWFDELIKAWVAADISPVFAMGNSGPNCGTANSPGDSQYTLAVGATDVNDRLARFSSRGPAKNGDRIKPEVSAPGLNIRSAWYTADNAYSSISGTSMASPHVTGAIALIRALGTKSPIATIQKDLEDSADTKLQAPEGATTCGGTSYTDVPNYLYGFGRINVCGAVKQEGGECQ